MRIPLTIIKDKPFLNGITYALAIPSGRPIETVDTFLPIASQTTAERHTNHLESYDVGDRLQRWMIGISTMSGCPVKCPFCAVTGVTERYGVRNLTADEMVSQVEFVLERNPDCDPRDTRQLKVQTTRMGEPSMNFATLDAIRDIHRLLPNAKVFVSTVGIQNRFLDDLLEVRDETPDEDYIQLQFSVHTTNETRRRELQPNGKLMTFQQIGEFGRRWYRPSDRKITLNFALSGKGNIDNHDFNPQVLPKYFDPRYFFIKLSPLNDNDISERNGLVGVIPQHNYA